jgi:hypothetical protein
MCGDVLRHYGGTAFQTYDDTVLLRIAEIPSENIGLRGGRRWCVHCSTDLPGRGIVGSWDRRSAMSCWASNISTVYMSAPAAFFIYTSAYTLSDPDLLKPKNPSAASTYSCATPALIHSWHALYMALLLSTGVHWRLVAARASV